MKLQNFRLKIITVSMNMQTVDISSVLIRSARERDSVEFEKLC